MCINLSMFRTDDPLIKVPGCVITIQLSNGTIQVTRLFNGTYPVVQLVIQLSNDTYPTVQRDKPDCSMPVNESSGCLTRDNIYKTALTRLFNGTNPIVERDLYHAGCSTGLIPCCSMGEYLHIETTIWKQKLHPLTSLP